MKLSNKVALLSVIVIIVTMPVSGQYVLLGLDWAFQQMFMRGTYVTLAACGYIIGFIFVRMYQGREKINIPAKPKIVKKIPVVIG